MWFVSFFCIHDGISVLAKEGVSAWDSSLSVWCTFTEPTSSYHTGLSICSLLTDAKTDAPLSCRNCSRDFLITEWRTPSDPNSFAAEFFFLPARRHLDLLSSVSPKFKRRVRRGSASKNHISAGRRAPPVSVLLCTCLLPLLKLLTRYLLS